MALGKQTGSKGKAGAAKSSPPRRVASMRPDKMHVGGGGLDDHFLGTWEEVRVVPWNYGGKQDTYSLAVRVKIRPDEEQEDDAIIRDAELEKNGGLIVQYYSAGKLTDFVPSMDGENPVNLDSDDEADWEGVYAIPTQELLDKLEARGTDLDNPDNWPQLNKSSNWAFGVQKLIDVGVDLEGEEGDVRFFEGLNGRHDRVPQPERKGTASSATGDSGRKPQILVMTHLVSQGSGEAEKPAAKGVAAKKGVAATGKAGTAAAAKKATAATNGSDDLSERVSAAIATALEAAEDGTLARTKLYQVANKVAKPAEKKAAMDLVKDDDWIAASEVFYLDEESGTVALMPTE